MSARNTSADEQKFDHVPIKSDEREKILQFMDDAFCASERE